MAEATVGSASTENRDYLLGLTLDLQSRLHRHTGQVLLVTGDEAVATSALPMNEALMDYLGAALQQHEGAEAVRADAYAATGTFTQAAANELGTRLNSGENADGGLPE